LRTFSLCCTALRIIGKTNEFGLQRITQNRAVLQPKPFRTVESDREKF
jgi:hypothetical protein